MQRYIILFLCLVLKTVSYAQAPIHNANPAVHDSTDYVKVSVLPESLKGRATKAKLLETGGLYVNPSGASVKYTVVSYTFMYFLSDRSLAVLNVNGPGFTDNMKKVIHALPSGSQLFFDDIKISASDGRTGMVHPFVLVLE